MMSVVYFKSLVILSCLVAQCDASTVGSHQIASMQCEALCKYTSSCVAYTYEKSDVVCSLELDKNKENKERKYTEHKVDGSCRCAAYSKSRIARTKKPRCEVCLDSDHIKEGGTAQALSTCFCRRRKWSYYNGSCYNSYYKKLTWNGALSLCKKKRGYLVEISDQREHEFVKGVVRRKTKTMRKIWVGASDTAKESQYIWRRTGERISNLKWCNKQPDNGRPLLAQNCLTMSGKKDLNCNWDLDDDTCFLKYYVLCEAKAKCLKPC